MAGGANAGGVRGNVIHTPSRLASSGSRVTPILPSLHFSLSLSLSHTHTLSLSTQPCTLLTSGPAVLQPKT